MAARPPTARMETCSEPHKPFGAGGLCARFQLSVSCKLDKHMEMLIIIRQFLRALKHSKTPVLPERNPYVSKGWVFFYVPLLRALLRKMRWLPGISTARNALLMLLFYKQPGVCILLLRTVYPLQSLRATVRGRAGGTCTPPGADRLGHDSASKRKILPWVDSGQGGSSTASAARCGLGWRGLAPHPGSCRAVLVLALARAPPYR